MRCWAAVSTAGQGEQRAATRSSIAASTPGEASSAAAHQCSRIGCLEPVASSRWAVWTAAPKPRGRLLLGGDRRGGQAGEERLPVLVLFHHPREIQHFGRYGGHGDLDPLQGQMAVVEEETAAGEGRARVRSEDLPQIHREEAVPPSGLPQQLAGRRGGLRRAQGREGGVGGGVDLGEAGRPRSVEVAEPPPGLGEEAPGGGAGAAVEVPHRAGGFQGCREISAVEPPDGLRVERVPAGRAVPGQPGRRLAGLPVGQVDFGDHGHDRDADGPGDLRDGAEGRVRDLPEPLVGAPDRSGDPLLPQRRGRSAAGRRRTGHRGRPPGSPAGSSCCRRRGRGCPAGSGARSARSRPAK